MLVCKGDQVHKLQAESGGKRGKFRQHHDTFARESTKAINVVVAQFLNFLTERMNIPVKKHTGAL
jgi:hypothetical protein